MARVVITSGGTSVPIDAVRSITNFSKGLFGSQIAKAALDADNVVNHVVAHGSHRPDNLTINVSPGVVIREDADPPGQLVAIDLPRVLSQKPLRELSQNEAADVREHLSRTLHAEVERRVLDMAYRLRNYWPMEYVTYEQYRRWLLISTEPAVDTSSRVDIIVLAAAVSDFAAEQHDGKISSDSSLLLQLHPTEKIISTVRKRVPDALLVGFKLLPTYDRKQLSEACWRQITLSGSDIVVGNDLANYRDGRHLLHVVSRELIRCLPPYAMPLDEHSFEMRVSDGPLAPRLWDFIENAYCLHSRRRGKES